MSEERLRTALRELGDVPPPADLAGGALSRARRDRHRRGVALAAVTALAVTAAVAVPSVLRGRAEAPPAAPAPAVWVSCYRTIGPARSNVPQEHCYDAAARGYRATPHTGTAMVGSVSPDGSQAVAVQTGAGGSRMAVVRLDRLAAGMTEADWRPRLPLGPWTWSPDGTRLLSPDDFQRPTQAVVVDVRTRSVTRIPLRLDELRTGPHGLAWGPGGRGFVTWRAAGPGDPASGELVVYDEAGQPTRRYAAPVVNDVVRLSPDGSRALLIPYDPRRDVPGERAWLLDLETGARTALALPPDQWYDDGHLIRLETWVRPGSITVIEADTERVVHRTPSPVAAGAQLVGIQVVRGTPPPGAIVL